MVHSIKTEDFVAAAQLQGIPALAIIVTQIIPQMASILIVSVALGIPGFILGETVLSYLGLGITDPAVSWGSMLNRNVTQLSNLRSFPWFLYPGAALILVTLAFNFLGDLLRDHVRSLPPGSVPVAEQGIRSALRSGGAHRDVCYRARAIVRGAGRRPGDPCRHRGRLGG